MTFYLQQHLYSVCLYPQPTIPNFFFIVCTPVITSAKFIDVGNKSVQDCSETMLNLRLYYETGCKNYRVMASLTLATCFLHICAITITFNLLNISKLVLVELYKVISFVNISWQSKTKMCCLFCVHSALFFTLSTFFNLQHIFYLQLRFSFAQLFELRQHFLSAVTFLIATTLLFSATFSFL